MAQQTDFFARGQPKAVVSALPDGMRYQLEFLPSTDEQELIARICEAPLANAEYLQYTARRRVVSYGGVYDFAHRKLNDAPPIPDWLQNLKASAARWARLTPEDVSQCLIAEYAPGTPLGWHRDVPEFESIVGISLAGIARLRLRRYPPQRSPGRKAKAELAIDVAPRSIYTLQGEARWGWQHAVSPTKTLRYSITFRTRRGSGGVSHLRPGGADHS